MPGESDLWVVAVGELDQNTFLYPWAVLSTPYATSLFIVARDVDDFREKYEKDVLLLVKRLGFTEFYNEPVPTFQSTLLCQYAEEPEDIKRRRLAMAAAVGHIPVHRLRGPTDLDY